MRAEATRFGVCFVIAACAHSVGPTRVIDGTTTIIRVDPAEQPYPVVAEITDAFSLCPHREPLSKHVRAFIEDYVHANWKSMYGRNLRMVVINEERNGELIVYFGEYADSYCVLTERVAGELRVTLKKLPGTGVLD